MNIKFTIYKHICSSGYHIHYHIEWHIQKLPVTDAVFDYIYFEYIFSFFSFKVSLGLFSVLFLWYSVWWLVKWGLTDRVVLKGDNWWAIAFQLLRPWSPSPDGLDLSKGKIKGTHNVQSQEETGPKYSYTYRHNHTTLS